MYCATTRENEWGRGGREEERGRNVLHPYKGESGREELPVERANQKHTNRPRKQIPTSGIEVWYTSSALNTSVVLCGPSGAVLDLRFPPPVCSVRFTRNLKVAGKETRRPARYVVCAPRRLRPARK